MGGVRAAAGRGPSGVPKCPSAPRDSGEVAAGQHRSDGLRLRLQQGAGRGHSHSSIATQLRSSTRRPKSTRSSAVASACGTNRVLHRYDCKNDPGRRTKTIGDKLINAGTDAYRFVGGAASGDIIAF